MNTEEKKSSATVSPSPIQFEWIYPNGIKILCDYADCEKGSMVRCTKCNSTLCLEHQQLHLVTCGLGLSDVIRYELERDAEKLGASGENVKA